MNFTEMATRFVIISSRGRVASPRVHIFTNIVVYLESRLHLFEKQCYWFNTTSTVRSLERPRSPELYESSVNTIVVTLYGFISQ